MEEHENQLIKAVHSRISTLNHLVSQLILDPTEDNIEHALRTTCYVVFQCHNHLKGALDKFAEINGYQTNERGRYVKLGGEEE